VTLTFDLLTSKLGQGSPRFVPVNFQLDKPFRSRLRVRYVTDRLTDIRRSSTLNASAIWGQKHSNVTFFTPLLDRIGLCRNVIGDSIKLRNNGAV